MPISGTDVRTVFVTLPLALAAALFSTPVAAQEVPLDIEVDLPAGVTGYAADIPTPEEVIHHRIGTRHTRSSQLVDYVRAIAAASDRVTDGEHGLTYQGRPLVHAIITSPENHRRLEQIRRANLRLSDDPNGVSGAELAGMPTIVYLGYNVHGNEASASEAAVLTLYHLAAGDGPAVQSVLDNTVVILDPVLNPDGRDRFVNWVNENRGRVPTSDPQDREHNSPWPGGRTNHYLFDLNRDWLPAAHPESRGRLELYQHWRPQLHTDYHEMGGNATYFFQPGVPSRDNPNTPQSTIDLTGRVAEYHARMLDRIGALYYTREQFDDFYYGKGSTYPDVTGAIGILYEQASSRALLAETQFGELTYAFTIRNQFLTSLSTLEAAVGMREDLLRHQRDLYAGASDFARQSPVRAYVLAADGDRTRAQKLVQMLQRHRIRVHELARGVDGDGRRFEPGEAYIVPVDQPQARLIQGAMERRFEFEDSLFYDVSTWTAQFAYGVEHAEVNGNPAGLIGDEVADLALDGGEVVGGRSDYAYVMEWGRYYAPRALYRLQDAGIRPLLSMHPFETDVAGERRRFERGAVVIPVAQRDAASDMEAEEVHALVDSLAREDHVRFHAVRTGLTPTGFDLGTRSSPVLEKPEVALLSGSGTNANQVGETWHLLNERMGIPVSLLDVDAVEGADLSRYNTLVMAAYFGGLSGNAEEKIEDWVRAGGTLIATTNSVSWAVGRDWIDGELNSPEEDTVRVPYADIADHRGAQQIGGSIFEAEVDTTHPIAFGYNPGVPLFRNNRIFLEPSDQSGMDVARYSDDPLLSGYISEPNLETLRGKAAITAQRAGSGRVVMFTDNPNFRAFWHGTNGLFLNAVFFGRSF